MVSNVHHNLCGFVSLRGSRHSEDRPYVTRTVSMEQTVVVGVDRIPSTSVLAVTIAVEKSVHSIIV